MKKLNSLKWFTLGAAMCLLFSFFAFPALASSTSLTAELFYKNIKICIDGQTLIPKDTNGDAVEPFIYNGTTYLPVRAVGEALGKTVTWDGNTNTVYLGQT